MHIWQKLWFLLDKHHTPPLHGEEQMISYQDFLLVASEAGPKCKSVPCLCTVCYALDWDCCAPFSLTPASVSASSVLNHLTFS